MDNYEYLIAGLPALSSDVSGQDCPSASVLIKEIRELSSDKDNILFDTLLKGYEEENFTPEFYGAMLSHPNRFLREFFRFDLNVRNAKVRYLNESLGRPRNTDIFLEDEGEFEEEAEVHRVLYGPNLLSREKGLDELMWKKIDEISAEIGKLGEEIKAKKAELKKLMKAKADMEKAAAEKLAQENKARILAAVEASGKSVDEILELLK